MTKKKKGTINWKVLLMGTSALFLLAYILRLKNKYRYKQLQANHIIVSDGKIADNIPRNGKYITKRLFYHFNYKNEGYLGHIDIKSPLLSPKSIFTYNNCADYFLNKHFPIAIDPENPSNNKILITPDEFKAFGYSFPDSLNWVLSLEPGR